jgi:hypothetical protein
MTGTESRSAPVVSGSVWSAVVIEAAAHGADGTDFIGVSAVGSFSAGKVIGDGTAVVAESDNPAGEPDDGIFPTRAPGGMVGKAEWWTVWLGDIDPESTVLCMLAHCGSACDEVVPWFSPWDEPAEDGSADSAGIGMEGCILRDAPGPDVSPAEGIGSDLDGEHSGGMAAGGIAASE